MPASVFVFQSRRQASGGLAPIGSRREVEAALAPLNTAPESSGGDVLYGPGFELRIQPGQDPITQMELTETDESICRPTVWTIARRMQWKLIDGHSGQEYTP